MEITRVPITIEVVPDFIVIKEHRSGEFIKCSYVLSHSFCLTVDCEKNGEPKKYSSMKYRGFRITNTHIELLNENSGWQVDEAATEKYFEMQAEKELLGK